jgi:hypothetical protein
MSRIRERREMISKHQAEIQRMHMENYHLRLKLNPTSKNFFLGTRRLDLLEKVKSCNEESLKTENDALKVSILC